MIESLLGRHAKNETSFFIHDYLPEDPILLNGKLKELENLMMAFNAKGRMKKEGNDFYGAYFCVKKFEWSLRNVLKVWFLRTKRFKLRTEVLFWFSASSLYFADSAQWSISHLARFCLRDWLERSATPSSHRPCAGSHHLLSGSNQCRRLYLLRIDSQPPHRLCRLYKQAGPRVLHQLF